MKTTLQALLGPVSSLPHLNGLGLRPVDSVPVCAGIKPLVVLPLPVAVRLLLRHLHPRQPLDVPHPDHAGHDGPHREPVVAADGLAVELVGQQHVAAGVRRLLYRDAGVEVLHVGPVVQTLEDDVPRVAVLGLFKARSLQNIDQPGPGPLSVTNGPASPVESFQILPRFHLQPPVAPALHRGHDGGLGELLDVLEGECCGFAADPLHLQRVLLRVHLGHGQVAPHEHEVLRRDEAVPEDGERGLGIERLLLVHNKGWVPLGRVGEWITGVCHLSFVDVYILLAQVPDPVALQRLVYYRIVEVHGVHVPEWLHAPTCGKTLWETKIKKLYTDLLPSGVSLPLDARGQSL